MFERNSRLNLLKPRQFIALLQVALIIVLPSLYLPIYANKFPVTVIDDRNVAITITKKPQKVAAISTFAADMLASLNQQAVGLSTLNHKQSAYLPKPEQAYVDLGEIHESNLELLTQLEPDLIVGLRQYTDPFADKFSNIANFLAYDLITYQDSINAVNSLGKALGEPEKSLIFNQQFEQLLKQYNQEVPGELSAVLLWDWSGTLFAFYDHSFSVEIMKNLKVKNLMGPSPTPTLKKPDAGLISMEALLALDPDVIIVFKGDNSPINPHPLWQRLSSVKNNRVYQVADQYIMPHGPLARKLVLREMAHLFYPQIFSKPKALAPAAQAKSLSFN